MEKSKSVNSSTNTSIQEQLKHYIKHVETGAIFQMRSYEKDEKKLYLRAKNSYQVFTQQHIKQGIVNGVWREPNEHELRKHIEEENKYFEEYSYRLIKRVIYTQLLLELDSDLMQDHADDKDMRKLLERCETRFERLVKDHFARLYHTDKDYLTNFMNGIDNVVSKMAKVGVHEFLIIDRMMDDYLADPAKYTPDHIEMVKIDGHIVEKEVELQIAE